MRAVVLLSPPRRPGRPVTERVGPQQVLLGVGAVLVVAVGAGAVLNSAGDAGRLAVAGSAAGAAVLSLLVARRGLRVAEETAAAASAVLGLLLTLGWGAVGTRLPGVPTYVVGEVLLAVAAAVLTVLARSTAGWPLTACTAGQLAVLGTVTGSATSPATRVVLLLGAAVAGLMIARAARSVVAVVALVSSVPWLLAGSIAGLRAAWVDPGGAALLAGLLLVVAGWAVGRLDWRGDLYRFLGPRLLLPLVGGGLAGLGVAGALHAQGPSGVEVAAALGLGVAVGAAQHSRPVPRVWRPWTLVAGAAATGSSVVELVATGRWTAVSLLLIAAAAVALVDAVPLRTDDSGAAPVALVCTAAGVGLQVPAGHLGPQGASLVVLVIAALALVGGRLAGAAPAVQPLMRTSGVLAVAAFAVVARLGAWGWLAAELVGWGLTLLGCAALPARAPATRSTEQHTELAGGADRLPTATLGLTRLPATELNQAQLGEHERFLAAGRTVFAAHDDIDERPDDGRSTERRLGALALAAGWCTGLAGSGTTVVEAYSVPLAATLLAAAGWQRLRTAPSWTAWGPAAVIAAVPSLVRLLGSDPSAVRTWLVVAVAAAVLVSAVAGRVRAPLEVAAGVLLLVAGGVLFWALPGALLVVVSVVGLLLWLAEARYELLVHRHVRSFVGRLSEFR